MSYEAYKVLHILGILVLFASLGGMAGVRMMTAAGSTRGPRLFRVLHGVAMAIVLIAGFGILSQLGMSSPGTWPLWVWIKVTVWLLLGAAIVILKKSGAQAGSVLAFLALLGAVAAWSAIVKP